MFKSLLADELKYVALHLFLKEERGVKSVLMRGRIKRTALRNVTKLQAFNFTGLPSHCSIGLYHT